MQATLVTDFHHFIAGHAMNRNLDVLRAIAVLLVLVMHLLKFHGVRGIERLGLSGVLLFFVHTCLVLMMSLERHGETWLQFMTRRVFRILPLSMLFVLVVNLAGIPQSSLRAGSMRLPDLDVLGFTANLLLFQNFTKYPSSPGVLWSLPYELQMYLFLPALFMLAIRRQMAALFALWVAAIAMQYLQHRTIGVFPDFLSFVPCFLPGVMAFALSKTVTKPIPAWCWPLFVIGIVTAFWKLPFTGANAVMCLIAGLLLPRFRELPEGWLTTFAAVIARYSYGIYLSHMLCIWLAFMRLQSVPPWAQWTVFAVSATTLPVLLYHAVEKPMIRIGARVASRERRGMSLLQPA